MLTDDHVEPDETTSEEGATPEGAVVVGPVLEQAVPETEVPEDAAPEDAVSEDEDESPAPPVATFGTRLLSSLPASTTLVGLAAAIACSVFIFLQMRPDLLLMNSTPAGGDMGAHVWGPAYMRDQLLSSGRVTGWTPDWYAGFPAYHFYMVVPSLAIIALNAGVTPWLGVPAAAALLFGAHRLASARPAHRALIWSVAAVAAVLVVALPYGVAFKLVSVAGLVLFPVAAYAMGRLADSPRPVPAFLALGATVFLFDTNFSIYGGNIASTLAGEFAFSLSLCLTLVAIGLGIKGMDRNGDEAPKGRASAAIVIALVALCHIIPLFFAMAALVLLVILDDELPRLWAVAAGITMSLIPMAFSEGSSLAVQAAAVGAFLVVVVSVALADRRVQARLRWLLVVGPVSALLAMFWLAPFYLRSDYFNDMGWERLDDVWPAIFTTPMRFALPVAAVGALLAFAIRDRMGMLFSILAVTFGSAVVNLPDGKLWNARLLPFFYLSVFIVAAIGVGLAIRFAGAAVAERLDRPHSGVLVGGTLLGLAGTLVLVATPLRVLPFGGVDAEGQYGIGSIRTSADSFIPDWVAWNYSGYEEKRSYLEYRGVVAAMDEVGQRNGCGRAMWEYDSELNRYGTPMALMLLPHWTDGCIGSMEGLYFESSATTPFHFLNQSMLSIGPSRAQRDLPYQNFDIDRGIGQLQVMGVRYYMAQTDEAIEAARSHEDLTELVTAEPFVVFEVAETALVEGLDVEPVVANGPLLVEGDELASRFDEGWLSQAVAFYNDPEGYRAMPAIDGPDGWQRVDALLPSDGIPVDVPATVSDIDIDNDRISFTVDQLGSPVLVKTSYFPNWQASGADGPWQVGPNLMVVVPTDTQVELSYGRTLVDRFGSLLTLVGVVGLIVLGRRDRRLAPV